MQDGQETRQAWPVHRLTRLVAISLLLLMLGLAWRGYDDPLMPLMLSMLQCF